MGKNKINKKGQRGRALRERERASVREDFIFIFLLFAFFSDIQKLDRRFSSGLKAKLIYTMRATRGHQKFGLSTNSVR